YAQGRQRGDFESGVRMALQSILASPRFLFRLEQAPAVTRAAAPVRISDQDLASRLSFFLWDTVPDAELVKAAAQGALRTPAGLERQVRRMLADSRAEALSTRFASQWLRLQDLDQIFPDYLLYPQYDEPLAKAMRRETELFFDSIVRGDGDVLELLTADYTFVNERLAKHYGMPNVTGNAFRRVPVPDYRRGLLGQGSVTENLMTYALGRRVEYRDMPAVRAIIRDAAARGNRMSAYILGVVNSAAFRMVKTETTTQTTDAR